MLNIDFSSLSDYDLEQCIYRSKEEINNRRSMANVLNNHPELTDGYQTIVLGRTMGDDYVEPLGYYDAYPKDWEVKYNNKLWKSLRAGAIGIPGESPDWQQVVQGEEIPNWVQPQAGGEYPLGAKVKHNGRIWQTQVDRNGWQPGTNGSQWVDLGPA